MGISQLNKLGLKKVKVIRHSQINKLIETAVNNVISKRLTETTRKADEENAQTLRALLEEKERALKNGETLKSEQQKLTQQINDLNKKLNEKESNLKQSQQKILEESRNEYKRLVKQKQAEQEINNLKEAVTELNSNLEAVTKENAELEKNLAEKSKELDQTIGKLKEQFLAKVENEKKLKEAIANAEEEKKNLLAENDLVA